MKNKFTQIIIYGAKGWLGRSAIEALEKDLNFNSSDLLCVGRKTEKLPNSKHLIFSKEDAFEKIKPGALFFNSAYLRREKIYDLGINKYKEELNEIGKFPRELIRSQRVSYLINLSSGAVKSSETPSDLYSINKRKDLEELKNLSNNAGINFLNCNIYSLTGKFLNEFNNLAISSFFQQSLSDSKEIFIKSPKTIRTYIDAVNLCEVLFKISLDNLNLDLDSGGELVNMIDLAEMVLKVTERNKPLIMGLDMPSEYFGNFDYFNNLAKSFEIKIINLMDQLQLTLPVFLNR